MLQINIPEPSAHRKERTLRKVVEERDEGVYRVTSKKGKYRIYVNCMGQYFIFNVAPIGTTVLVQADDTSWLDETVLKTDENITVTFSKN